MNWKVTNRVLGSGSSYVPQKKEWIAAAIGAAVSIGSAIFGASKSSSEQAKAEAEQRKKEAAEAAWYNRRYNENYADTAAGQNLLRQARDFADSNWKKAQGAAAVGGGTEASAQMAKDAGNKVVGDTMANIAATDMQRKDNVDNIHQQNQQRFSDQQQALHQQKAANISNAASAFGNAAMSVGDAVDSYRDAKIGNNALSKATGGSVRNNNVIPAGQPGAGMTYSDYEDMLAKQQATGGSY